MDTFLNLVKKRRSIRKYQNRQIEPEKTKLCLEAARLAPSGQNKQPWRFTVINKPELLKEVTDAACSGIYGDSKFIKKAPLLISVSIKKDILVGKLGKAVQGVYYPLVDIGLASQNLVMQAEELGIGSCYIGWFNIKKTKKELKIKKDEKLVMLIAMGYPEKELSGNHKRKTIEEITRFNPE